MVDVKPDSMAVKHHCCSQTLHHHQCYADMHRIIASSVIFISMPVTADWDSALAVNLKGYAFGIKHASQAMIKQAKQAAEQPAEGTSSSPGSSGYAIVNLASTGAFACPV